MRGRKDWTKTRLNNYGRCAAWCEWFEDIQNPGFSVKDKDGKRVAIDDPRSDAVWDKCGELKIPVLIHG